MKFADKLKNLMKDLGISQSKLSDLTGIGKSSISQYLSGKNEPAEDRKKQIALALGVQENYFKEWVMQGLRDGVFPWGYAVKLSKWSYFISSVKFTEYTGIQIPAE